MAALFGRCFRAACILNKETSAVVIKSRLEGFFRQWSSSSSPMNMMDLTKRGLFENVFPDTRLPDLMKLLSTPQSLYCGFDPTANSLHIGNLLSLITLLHGQRGGHRPIALIGGATAAIGDPSGKTKDRVPMTAETIENNIVAIMENVERVVNNHREFIYKDSRELPEFKIVNNQDWYKDMKVIPFLATVGRHFRLGEMISKTSVQSRLNSKEGISCTEFMYQIFQANDWLHLFQNYNCTLQIGGVDQTGNISAGFDLIHKVTQKYAFGFLVPLLLSPSGEKLGKSTGNSMWLDPAKTSPFELYQYFFNMPDTVVEKYLRMFTFLSLEEIQALMEEHQQSPDKRPGQKKLAEQITLLVHGESGIDSALRCTEVLFGDSVPALTAMKLSELLQLFRNAPTTDISYDASITVIELCRRIKCFQREVDADRIIKAGGLYINQQRVSEPNHLLRDGNHILPNKITLVRVGKKNFYIVKWNM